MFVFSNLATSLDGKIGVRSREHFMLGTKEDVKNMMLLRRHCDAIVMGASTLRSYKMPCLIRDEPAPSHQPANVILTRAMEGFDPKWKFFTDSRIKRICFVSELPNPAVRAQFENLCEIIELKGPREESAKEVLEALEDRGFERVLVEGGGNVMWDFAAHNLIDEYNVTLTPRILGGIDAPTLVDGVGFTPKEVVNLKLKSCRVEGDEIYLVYSKTAHRGP